MNSGQQRWWRVASMPTKVGNRGATARNFKNEDRTDYVHENTGPYDNIADNQSGFLAYDASFLRKWTTIQRPFWRKVYMKHDNFGEAGTQIGSSVGRPIGPSAEGGVVLRWPDETMVR